jgi:hypothetical protein
MNARNLVAEVSRKKLGILRHPGVLLPSGKVAHNTPRRGEHISTVEEFADGEDVIIDFVVPESERQAVLNRILTAVAAPQRYDLFQNNCEVYANRMLARQPISPQLRFAVFLAVGVGLIALCAE